MKKTQQQQREWMRVMKKWMAAVDDFSSPSMALLAESHPLPAEFRKIWTLDLDSSGIWTPHLRKCVRLISATFHIWNIVPKTLALLKIDQIILPKWKWGLTIFFWIFCWRRRSLIVNASLWDSGGCGVAQGRSLWGLHKFFLGKSSTTLYHLLIVFIKLIVERK